jgi:hypothetical protein
MCAPHLHAHGSSYSIRRFLERLVGTEKASNLVFHIPKIDIQRNSFEVLDIAHHLGREYLRVCFSRTLVLQVVRQLPSLILLARVGILTMLRTPRRGLAAPIRRRMDGLLIGTDDSYAQSQLPSGVHERASARPSHADENTINEFEKSSWHSARSRSSGMHQRINVLDISGKAMEHGVFVAGLELFLRLTAKDIVLQRTGDIYKFYVPYNASAAVLVTNRHLLFVRLDNESIMEPRVAQSDVTGYSLRDDVLITIHCSGPRTEPPRIWSRDTGTMVDAMMQTMSFTMQCDNPATAEWLLRNLPFNPTINVTRRERL